jgi:DNA-binding NarL/FixJ family response regulator
LRPFFPRHTLIPVAFVETTLRVYVVEDSPLFVKAIETLLAENDRIAIVGCAGEAGLAMREIRRLAPQVVILDFHLTSGNGIDVLKSIRTQKQTSPVAIMFSSQAEPAFRSASLRLGADFVFEKSHDFDRLAQLLRSMTVTESTVTESERTSVRVVPAFPDCSAGASRNWY